PDPSVSGVQTGSYGVPSISGPAWHACCSGPFEGALSPSHLLIVLIVGILLFGKRLPEMGRHLGKGLIEFQKGLKGLEDEPEGPSAPHRPVPPTSRVEDGARKG